MSRIPKFDSKRAIGTSLTTDEVPDIPVIRKVVRNNMRRSKSFSDMTSSSHKFLPPASSMNHKFRMNLNSCSSSLSTKGILLSANRAKTVNYTLNITKATGSQMNIQRKVNNIGSEVQKKAEKTVPVNADEVSELPVFKKGLRSILRRSKSFSDVKTSKNIPLSCFSAKKSMITNPANTASVKTALKSYDKTNIVKNTHKVNLTKSVPTVSNMKRKGENADSAVKPKMVKKVPDWDYKTKWGLLNEKHKNLVQEYKSCQTLVSEHRETAQKYQDILLEVDQLKQEKENFQFQINNLKSHNMSLGKSIENLERQLNEANIKITSIEAIRNDLESKYQLVNFNMDCIKKEYDTCEANFERISQQLESTKEEKEYWKNEFQRVEHLRRQLHNEIQDIKGNIRVFCRVRPPLSEQETC